MSVRSNGHWRELLAADELPGDVLESEFGYVLEGEPSYSPRFFEYRGVWYDSHEFEFVSPYLRSAHPEFGGWDGFRADSFYSGIVIRYAPEANDYDLEPFGWVQVGLVVV